MKVGVFDITILYDYNQSFKASTKIIIDVMYITNILSFYISKARLKMIFSVLEL